MIIRAGVKSPAAGTVQHHILGGWYVGVFLVVQDKETNQDTTPTKSPICNALCVRSTAATDGLVPLGQSQQ